MAGRQPGWPGNLSAEEQLQMARGVGTRLGGAVGNLSAREQAEPTFSLRELLEAVSAPPRPEGVAPRQVPPQDPWTRIPEEEHARRLAIEQDRLQARGNISAAEQTFVGPPAPITGQSKTRPMTPEEWGLPQTSAGELGSLTPKEQTELAGVKSPFTEAWGASSRLSEEEANREYAEWQKQETIKRQDAVKELMESRQLEAMINAAGGVPEAMAKASLSEEAQSIWPGVQGGPTSIIDEEVFQAHEDNFPITERFAEQGGPLDISDAREGLRDILGRKSPLEHPLVRGAERRMATLQGFMTEEDRGIFSLDAITEASGGRISKDDLRFAEIVDAGYVHYGSLSEPMANLFAAVAYERQQARNAIVTNLTSF